jgi:branched-chain amino acid transport system permease protein
MGMRGNKRDPGGARRRPLVAFLPHALALAFLIFLPAVFSPFAQGIVAKAFCFAIFAMSLDLLIGYTGLLSLGHAAFFGTGGYAAAMLMLHGGTASFWITAPVGIAASAAMAALLGLIVVRFKGLYFLLLTFALGEFLFSIVWKFKWFQSPGIEAVIGLARPDLGLPGFRWNATTYYYFVLLFFLASFFLMNKIVNSPFGHALKGIRENEPRMLALGYNTWLYKYVAYVVSGLFAGVGGVFFVYTMRFAVPELLSIQYSFIGTMMVILGGAGSIFGPAIGGLLMVVAELLVSLVAPVRWPLFIGIIFVATIMFSRGGLAPYLKKCWRGFLNRYGSIES